MGAEVIFILSVFMGVTLLFLFGAIVNVLNTRRINRSYSAGDVARNVVAKTKKAKESSEDDFDDGYLDDFDDGYLDHLDSDIYDDADDGYDDGDDDFDAID